MALKGIFNKIYNPIISTSTLHDREISDSRSFTKLDLEGYKFSRLLGSQLLLPRLRNIHLLDNYNPNFNYREGPRYSTPTHRTLYLIEALRYSIKNINSLGTSKKVTNKKFAEVFDLNEKYITQRRKNIRDGVNYIIGSDLLLDSKIILSSLNDISERKFDFAIRAIKSYQDFYHIPEVYSQYGVEEQKLMLNLRKAFTPPGNRLVPVQQIERLLELGEDTIGKGIFGKQRSLLGVAAETYLQKLLYKIWKSDYENLDKISAYSAITDYALEMGYNEERLRTYYVPPDATNQQELEIIAILKAAYSKHDVFKSARNQPTKGKLISNDLLYETILGRGKGNLLRNIIDSGRSIPVRLLKHIMKVVKRDSLHLLAFGEYVDLYKALHKYNPLFMVRYKQNYQYYYDVTEESFLYYLKNIQTRVDDYAPGFNSPSVRKTQINILLDQLGGRDAKTGELVRDPKTLELLKKIIRHHFKISNRYNKMDCSISALVPLTDASHGAAHTAIWEQRFTTLKWFVERGLPFIPSWWSKQNQKDHADYLRKLGYNL